MTIVRTVLAWAISIAAAVTIGLGVAGVILGNLGYLENAWTGRGIILALVGFGAYLAAGLIAPTEAEPAEVAL